VQGFCIVSSGSDYTRLATRIREDGLFVIGVGEKKAPEAFVNACNQFIYSENLTVTQEPKKKGRKRKKKEEGQDTSLPTREHHIDAFAVCLGLSFCLIWAPGGGHFLDDLIRVVDKK